MSGRTWTDAEIRWIAKVLGHFDSVAEACAYIARETGRGVTTNNLTTAFRSRGLPKPVEYLRRTLVEPRPGPRPRSKGPKPALPPLPSASVEHVAPPPLPEEMPTDPVARSRQQRDESQLRREHKELLDRLKEAEQRQAFLDELSATPASPVILPRERKSGVREATAIALASDWHVEEVVTAASVAGRNEYNLAIAERRVAKYFQGVHSLLEFSRGSWRVRDLILWLGGDLMTGFIHPELEESNELSPIETIIWLRERLCAGIDGLLADPKLEKLTIPASYGNHGRTTQKRRIKTGARNSYEWLLYQWLKSHYAHEKRIVIDAGQTAHQFVDAYGKVLHFHHGDEVRYWGGVGGLSIPLNKRVPKWDNVKRSDYHFLGHFHELLDLGHTLINGSLIGYTEFAYSIGAEFEPPQQAFTLLDSKRGRCLTAPIWVD